MSFKEAPGNTMRVYRYHPPGGPEKILPGVESIPIPQARQVLIRVHAVSIIAAELTWNTYRRDDGSWKSHILGHDFSGEVAELGPDCPANSEIRVGSEVVAFTIKRGHEGGLAEYAIADLDCLVLKPSNLSWEEAASFPISGLTAYQALHDHAQIQPGQNILITAAAGGTGIFLVQLARLAGANKIICTARGDPEVVEMLKELGATEVIDYRQMTDLKSAVQDLEIDIDIVIDCVGNSTFTQCIDLVHFLNQNLEHSAVARDSERTIISIVEYSAKSIAEEKGVKADFFIVGIPPSAPSRNDLQVNDAAREFQLLSQMLQEGDLKTKIMQIIDFENAGEPAYKRAAQGGIKGKIIAKVKVYTE